MPRQGERGQALVELAIVTPVLLLLLLLATDFGRLFFTFVSVNNAAREGAYYASIHAADDPFVQSDYDDETRAAALREVNVQAQGGEGTLTISAPECFNPVSGTTISCGAAANYAGGAGNFVRVSAQQPFTFLTPLVGELFGGSLDLDATATAPVLDPPAVSISAPTPSPTPVPTATPTPSPSPTPTATATLPPGATPTPSPAPTATPTPTPEPTCTVPDFFNTFFNDPDALNTWHNVAGFTGTLTDESDDKRIKSQTLSAGSEVLCSSSMTVDDKN